MAKRTLLFFIGAALASSMVVQASAYTIAIGTDAGSYGLLFEGAGGNTLHITNVTVNGNVGVGLTGKASDSGPSTISGRVDFSAANTGQFSNTNAANIIAGGVQFNAASVTSALNTVNALNTVLGAETGTSVSIGTGGGKTLAINASDGSLDASHDRVFTVSGFNTTNGDTLTINGDAAHDNVVLNFPSSVNFNNQVVLTGGLTADAVLYNFVGGSNLTGGPTLQINNNASSSPSNLVEGIFLDPDGAVSVTNARVLGRVFGGDTHDLQFVSGTTLTAPALAVPLPNAAYTGLIVIAALSGARLVFCRRHTD